MSSFCPVVSFNLFLIPLGFILSIPLLPPHHEGSERLSKQTKKQINKSHLWYALSLHFIYHGSKPPEENWPSVFSLSTPFSFILSFLMLGIKRQLSIYICAKLNSTVSMFPSLLNNAYISHQGCLFFYSVSWPMDPKNSHLQQQKIFPFITTWTCFYLANQSQKEPVWCTG